MLEIRNGSMPLLLVTLHVAEFINGMGHSATCAADAPMSEKVSKPDTEPRRAHVTNVPEADVMSPVLPLKADIQREWHVTTWQKRTFTARRHRPKGCLILTALRQRLTLASEGHP